MLFSLNMQPVMFKYTINSVMLDRPDIIRDLGVSFDPKYVWFRVKGVYPRIGFSQ
jgi:hypothetical protein